ncbi:universal stress protein [Bauldia sp.]|uniref:universal stress protein n=1 Tax=Bauldia sp. TaxID=2575872 RepID=UPI003BAB68F0
MTTKQGAAIRDILVILDRGDEQRSAKIAADLARQAGAHLTGLAVALEPFIPTYTIAAAVPADFLATAREQSYTDAKEALARFDTIGQQAGVAVESRLGESVSGDGFAAVVRNAILADVAVVGQHNPDKPEPLREALIEALLFQAGVPTLIAPYAGSEDFDTDVAVVAWNGSPAAGRSVRAAMPLLSMAKEVVVVIVDEGRPIAGEPGADIGAYLARHDLAVTVRTIDNYPGGSGEAILSFAADARASWLVMGGYGHSRLREFLLGGATRHILANATLPVLMSH